MKMTLLDIVQDILSDLDSDEVNSIDDTTESMQVAQIVKSTYFAMMSNRNWPHLRKSLKLTNAGTPSRPTHMYVKDDLKELSTLFYDIRKVDSEKREYKEMKWVEPDAFLRKSSSLDNTKENVTLVEDTTGVELLILNDKAPERFTSFDDKTLIFDSYDKDVSDTLLGNRVQAMGYVMPDWEQVDEHIPDLPQEAFTALLEEAKSRCFIKLKQMADPTADAEARKQQRWLSRKAWVVEGGIKYPNYGRKRR